MGFGKWIGGIVGFMAAGPLGALAGYAIGSMLEGKEEDNYSGGGYGGEYTGHTYQDPAYGQRNSFLFSLLVMASNSISLCITFPSALMMYEAITNRENKKLLRWP